MHKVLIIDDEKSICSSLSSILQDEGFDVYTALDGKEGLALFDREKPNIVFIDVWMPEIDGLEVLHKIRDQAAPDTVLIVISGHGTISTAVEAVKMGANDFLEKPLSIEKVLEVINRGLDKKGNGKHRPEDLRIEITKGLEFKQKTIAKSVVVYGMGLHSGAKTGMILLPMPSGTGIIFEHVPDGERIPAFIDYVYSSGYASSIKGRNCSVRTVEHLLAACHMCGITNLLIKVSEEVPIFDGSAQEICSGILGAGIEEQEEGIEPVRVSSKLEVANLPQGKYLSIEPFDHLEIEYFLDYPKPIGKQEYSFNGATDDFARDIAPARTFGFIKDFQALAKMGLASGGRVNNVILMNDEQIINTELRFPDEFVRHKVLDLIGDLYLLSRPVIGKLVARGTGHMENIALVKELKNLLYN
jgi:UDP-3-O-[3-hydroxymyristoyl] N-acetylglucosamine deacetylase